MVECTVSITCIYHEISGLTHYELRGVDGSLICDSGRHGHEGFESATMAMDVATHHARQYVADYMEYHRHMEVVLA